MPLPGLLTEELHFVKSGKWVRLCVTMQEIPYWCWSATWHARQSLLGFHRLHLSLKLLQQHGCSFIWADVTQDRDFCERKTWPLPDIIPSSPLNVCDSYIIIRLTVIFYTILLFFVESRIGEHAERASFIHLFFKSTIYIMLRLCNIFLEIAFRYAKQRLGAQKVSSDHSDLKSLFLILPEKTNKASAFLRNFLYLYSHKRMWSFKKISLSIWHMSKSIFSSNRLILKNSSRKT